MAHRRLFVTTASVAVAAVAAALDSSNSELHFPLFSTTTATWQTLQHSSLYTFFSGSYPDGGTSSSSPLVDQSAKWLLNQKYNTSATSSSSSSSSPTKSPQVPAPEHLTGRRKIDSENKLEAHGDKTLRPVTHATAEEREAQRNSFSYAISTTIGLRKRMEDVHEVVLDATEVEAGPAQWFAVFDGHGGKNCAEFVKTKLLKQILSHPHFTPKELRAAIEKGFAEVDEAYFHERTNHKYPAVKPRISQEFPGSTALCMLMSPHRLVMMNIGDSRAVLYANGVPNQLNTDHKATDPKEEAYIKAQGSWLDKEGYVEGQLNVSRSFGDYDMKPPLTANPEIREVKLYRQSRSMVIMASDGLWDAVDNQQACDIAWGALSKGKSPQHAADLLLTTALGEGTTDNITVMVIDLQPLHTIRGKTAKRPTTAKAA